jgi:hypothetical protein
MPTGLPVWLAVLLNKGDGNFGDADFYERLQTRSTGAFYR